MLSLRADAAGMTISDYIRSKMVTDDDTQVRRVSRQRQLPSDVAEAVRVLSGIGVNLRTLRDQAVREGLIIDTSALDEAVAMIVEILRHLKG